MKPQTTVFFKIKHGNSGWINGKNGTYSFDTAKEAIAEAKAFKANPLSHNENMPEDSIKYWQSQTFVIIKETLTVEEIETI